MLVAIAEILRVKGQQPRPKTPITPDMLAFFVSCLSSASSIISVTLCAAMLICLFAMLRKSAVRADHSQPLSYFSGPAQRYPYLP